MAKVHLLSVESPRAIAGTVQADCGKEVRDSRMVAMFDSQAMGAKLELNCKDLCGKCVKVGKSERYTFGICESRMLKREEDLFI